MKTTFDFGKGRGHVVVWRDGEDPPVRVQALDARGVEIVTFNLNSADAAAIAAAINACAYSTKPHEESVLRTEFRLAPDRLTEELGKIPTKEEAARAARAARADLDDGEPDRAEPEAEEPDPGPGEDQGPCEDAAAFSGPISAHCGCMNCREKS